MKQLLLMRGLTGTIRNPHRAKGGCAGLLRGIPEYIPLPGDGEIFEPGTGDYGCQFCFQQSTSNSTGP